MTTRDKFGLEISSADANASTGYDAYVDQYISYGSALRDFFTVAEENPDSAFLNAHAASLHLAFEAQIGWTNAAPFLARMNAANAPQTEREALYCACVNAWAQKDYFTALAHLDELTVRWPADLCALKWGQYHAFNLGDQAALLRFGERARIAHENAPYVHGMVAFALEQNHRLTEAEEEGLRATEIAIDDAWAHHAVAHVMETDGRAHDGARWLTHCAHTWERKGVFIRIHNWWHASLFQLALGNNDAALEIFDNNLWGEWPEFPQEQIGATSLLWRLEMRGVDVGDRWQPIAEQARANNGAHLFPFHDAHYLYALARAGTAGEAEAFCTSLHQSAEENTTKHGEIWRNIMVPLSNGILAFSKDDFAECANCVQPITPRLNTIGGSHAQRHLFDELLETSVARANGGKSALAKL